MMTSWLCYGDVGLDRYPNQTYCGGISFNHLFHLHKLGEKNLSFYGPLSTSPEAEVLFQELKNQNVTIIDKEHVIFAINPPTQWISLEDSGEKKFDRYDGEIFNSFLYRQPVRDFDVVLIPVFSQNQKMVQDFFSSPCKGKVVVDILDGTDFDFNLENLRQWESMIDTLVVGCSVDKPDFFEQLKQSIDHFNWKLLVTRGAQNGFYFDGQELFPFSPQPLEKVVDSTGAGDAFLAGFLHHQLKGRASEDCLNFACRYAHTILQKEGSH